MITGVMKAILLLRLHKEQLGNALFPRIIGVIIDCIVEGLAKSEEDSISLFSG